MSNESGAAIHDQPDAKALSAEPSNPALDLDLLPAPRQIETRFRQNVHVRRRDLGPAGHGHADQEDSLVQVAGRNQLKSPGLGRLYLRCRSNRSRVEGSARVFGEGRP